LSCVLACKDTQLEISSNQYNIDKICRSTNFYVDPSSSKMIELGTKEYPYRNFRAVSSEILNHFSYKNLNITIYLKGGTKVYLEDDTTYFINIFSITITTYYDNSSPSSRALIVPTTIAQHKVNARAAFHLLRHTEIYVDEQIAQKAYSESTLGSFSMRRVTLKILEASFSLVDVDVYREAIDYNSESFFMLAIYIQNRDIVVSKPF
jgi:hypothetical protein